MIPRALTTRRGGRWPMTVAFFVLLAGCAREPERLLRVCADPNNLPFSDSTGAGFENQLATLVAGARRGASTLASD